MCDKQLCPSRDGRRLCLVAAIVAGDWVIDSGSSCNSSSKIVVILSGVTRQQWQPMVVVVVTVVLWWSCISRQSRDTKPFWLSRRPDLREFHSTDSSGVASAAQLAGSAVQNRRAP